MSECLNGGECGPFQLCLPAQGCEARATLGKRELGDINPNGVVARLWWDWPRVEPQPRWGWTSVVLHTLLRRNPGLWDGIPLGFGIPRTRHEDRIQRMRTQHAAGPLPDVFASYAE